MKTVVRAGHLHVPLRRIALSCCAVVALLVVGSAPAYARRVWRPPVVAGSRYLALGDSVTFGFREPQVVPTPNYKNAASFLGFPEHLGAVLHLRVANAACPGETSASFINPAAQSFGCENSPNGGPAYRKLFPLHVSYKGSQLAFAIKYLRTHRGVRLVSFMIGANDLFLCQATTPDHCLNFAELGATLDRVTRNTRQIISAIRNKAHYRGQLAIVNYYSTDYTSAFLNSVTTALNKALDKGAAPFHVVIADGFGEFQAAARDSGGSTCNAGLLTQLGKPGDCGVHPSYAGQALLAAALQKVIQLW